jgi:uncharacterized protein (DUF433 family)
MKLVAIILIMLAVGGSVDALLTDYVDPLILEAWNA